MKVSHSPDNIEHCFYIILPCLFRFDTFFLDAKRLIHAHGVIGVKNPTAIAHNRLRYSSGRKGRKQNLVG
jgi:hypothetical protein